MQTFTWSPDLGADRVKKPAVTPIKFGDGYEVRPSSSINTNPNSWSCSFTNSAKIAREIITFLDDRGGIEAFLWVDPMGETAIYVCRQYSSSQVKQGLYTVKCQFDQVFER